MPQPPAQPKIYHIFHIDRLASVVAAGGLWCDAEMQRRGGDGTVIGMGQIKARRLRLPVKCHPGDYVGEYVPFYFCPRSIMLFIIAKANHQDLTYRGGQGPIIHLEADFHATVAWAEAQATRWAFTLVNAGAAYAEFRARLDQLHEINWPAVSAIYWSSNRDTKEGKQAEFLLHSFFPWELVERIGTHSQQVADQAIQMIAGAAHRPAVAPQPSWYY